MNSSEYKQFACMSGDAVVFFGALQGAGAAAPVIPTNVRPTTTTKLYLARSNNFFSTVAGDITRSGAGAYTAKLRDSVPELIDVDINVWGTDGKQAQVTEYNPVTRVITFTVLSAAGAAADLAATDVARFTFTGQLTVPVY